MKLYIAPLQGYTDAPFRHFQQEIFGGADGAFTPFLRVEKDEPCRRTLRDIESALNENHKPVPQIIFRDADEFAQLAAALKARGFRRIDLNLGCPFPPQVHKGRGAGVLLRPDVLESVADMVRDDSAVEYSVKMRLGVDSPDQWRPLVAALNSMPLVHVAVHPRFARRQYRGDLHYHEFEALAAALRHPILFNGEIGTPDDIAALSARYQWLHGVMVGRGILSRPSLFAEYRSGEELSPDRRLSLHLQLHDALLEHYGAMLCGEHQVFAKIKTFWDYPPDCIDSRILKKLLKSRDIADYKARLQFYVTP